MTYVRAIQDRDRHIRTFLPYWVYCPFPRCPWRGDRRENLKDWKMAHASCSRVLVQEYCKIYDPSLLAWSAVCGKLSTESAAYTVLLEGERRAQELDIWIDWWSCPQKDFRPLRFGGVLRVRLSAPQLSSHPSTIFSPSYYTIMRLF